MSLRLASDAARLYTAAMAGAERRLKRRAIAPTFESAGEGIAVTLAGARALALPQGALWLESARALVVSDLHFEKGSAYARRGQLIPPYDTRATLRELTQLAESLAPRIVVCLGDSFHDAGAPARLDAEDAETIRMLTAGREWVWIEGNHDPAPPEHLGGRRASEIELAGLVLRHEAAANAEGEVSGHLHPCAKIAARGGGVRKRCFATDGMRLVMPAFGAYTGGLNVRDAAFESVFPNGCFALVMGKARLYPAPPERLAPDI